MRNRSIMLAVATAALALGGLPPGGGFGSFVQAMPSGVGHPSAVPAPGGAAATRRHSFTSKGGFGYKTDPKYIKRPLRTVAQDKRDARKRRNQLRNKGKR